MRWARWPSVSTPAESVYDDIRRAYATAVSGRRTVVINLALDVQAQQVTVPEMPDH